MSAGPAASRGVGLHSPSRGPALWPTRIGARFTSRDAETVVEVRAEAALRPPCIGRNGVMIPVRVIYCEPEWRRHRMKPLRRRVVWVIPLALALALPAPADAQIKTLTTVGTCGRWVEARRLPNSTEQAQVESWTIGFLSGWAVAVNQNLAAGTATREHLRLARQLLPCSSADAGRRGSSGTHQRTPSSTRVRALTISPASGRRDAASPAGAVAAARGWRCYWIRWLLVLITSCTMF